MDPPRARMNSPNKVKIRNCVRTEGLSVVVIVF